MQSVTEYDRATLERARFFLRTDKTLDEILRVPALAICLKNVAAIRIKKEAKFDARKVQSNDQSTSS